MTAQVMEVSGVSVNHNNIDARSRLTVSPEEAANLLGIGRTRLYEELGSGALPSFHVGRRRLIRLSAIEDWITEREVKV